MKIELEDIWTLHFKKQVGYKFEIRVQFEKEIGPKVNMAQLSYYFKTDSSLTF